MQRTTSTALIYYSTVTKLAERTSTTNKKAPPASLPCNGFQPTAWRARCASRLYRAHPLLERSPASSEPAKAP